MKRLLLALWIPVAAAADPALPPVPDEGPTGPVHTAHAGQVVFSRAKIDRAPADASGFVTEVTLADALYVRPFLRTSPENAMRADGIACEVQGIQPTRWTRVKVNDGDWAFIESRTLQKDNYREWTTWSLDASADTNLLAGPTFVPADVDKPGFAFGARVVPRLSVGANKLQVEFGVSCRMESGEAPPKTLARGDLTVQVKDGDVDRWLATKGPRLPESKHPEQATLKPKLIAALSAAWSNETVLDAVLPSPDWRTEQDPSTGALAERSTPAWALTRLKDKSTCRIFDLTLIQKSVNGGPSWSPDVTFAVGGSRDFPCPR